MATTTLVRNTKRIIPFDAQDANTVSGGLNTQDYRNIVLSVTGANTATGNLKIQGAIFRQEFTGLQEVDFTSPSTPQNPWSYVQLKDLSNENSINGTVGIPLADGTTLYAVNTDGLDSISLELTAVTTGDVTVLMNGYSNL